MLKVGLLKGEDVNVWEACFTDGEGEASTCTSDDDRLCGREISLVGVLVPVDAVEADATVESLAARKLMKLPIPEPQAPNVALAAWAVSARVGDATVGGVGSGGNVAVLRSPTPRDRGRKPPPVSC